MSSATYQLWQRLAPWDAPGVAGRAKAAIQRLRCTSMGVAEVPRFVKGKLSGTKAELLATLRALMDAYWAAAAARGVADARIDWRTPRADVLAAKRDATRVSA